MELREYIRIILQHLRLILVFSLVAFVITMLISYEQTPVFESTSSYVTRLDTTRIGSTDEAVYVTDTITNRPRIFVTYCDVMESREVRQEAYRLLGLNTQDLALMEELADYAVECTVLPESMVLTVTVQGTAPVLVERLNEAIGLAGMADANTLFEYLQVVPQDTVLLGEDPVSPNYVFNGALGVALGVMVSVTMVLLLDYLRTPQEQIASLSIYDPRVNVYNNRYLQRRLGEEIQRSRMQHRLLAVALVHLTPDENFELLAEEDQELLLRQAANRMKKILRETDILAYRGDNTFGIMMPETSEQDALMIFKQIHDAIHDQPIVTERYTINFSATTGLIENNGGTLETEETMRVVGEALQAALRSGLNSIEFVRTKPSAFILDGTELEHFHYDLTPSGGTSPFVADPDDPHATQPIPPLSVITGENTTPTARSSVFTDADESLPDTESLPPNGVRSRDRIVKDRILKKIRPPENEPEE